MAAIARQTLLDSMPPEPDVHALAEAVRRAAADPGRRLVVPDDDPTGVQTVHGIDVLTTWSVGDLAAALVRPDRLFYVLTNSRALDRPAAVALAAQLAANLADASEQTGVRADLISRGD